MAAVPKGWLVRYRVWNAAGTVSTVVGVSTVASPDIYSRRFLARSAAEMEAVARNLGAMSLGSTRIALGRQRPENVGRVERLED